MRILFSVPLLFAVSGPALAQQTAEPEERSVGEDTQFRLIVGAEHTRGEVGDGLDYETTSVSAGAAVTSGRFSASASLPYISSSAPEELVISQGGFLGTPLLASPGPETSQVTREGVGDLSLNVSYLLPVSIINASIGGAVKVPTASREKGLGTGELDYGISGQLSKRVGSFIPFVAGGYTIVGEPEEFDVRNTLAATAGSHVLLGGSSSVTGFYSYDQSASPQIGDNQRVGLALSTGLSTKIRVGIEGTAGLSEDAPDARVGLSIGIGL